jgi:hypothetical protein
VSKVNLVWFLKYFSVREIFLTTKCQFHLHFAKLNLKNMFIFYDSAGGRPQGGEDTENTSEGKNRVNISTKIKQLSKIEDK